MSIDRCDLRMWVLHHFGDGETVACVGCGNSLDQDTLTLDHYPIPAFMGGTYRQDNVRPMCAPCNSGNQFTPSREEVEQFAAENGITLRPDGCPQYSAQWYREHRVEKFAPLTYSLADRMPRMKVSHD